MMHHPSAVDPVKDRETVTVIGCGNALGQQIPPFFSGQRMLQELPAGCTPVTDGNESTGLKYGNIQELFDESFSKICSGQKRE